MGGRVVYHGRILDVHLDRVRFPDGSQGELEIIRHPGAAAVVALDVPPEGGAERRPGTDPAVVLLRQYRYAAGGEVWEIPAGKLDGDEAPEACARRELEEEAGVRARELRRLATIYTTPGFTDERIHLFLARGLEPGRVDHEASEFIERRNVAFSRAIDMVRSGEIVDSKTICGLLYAASFTEAAPPPGTGGAGGRRDDSDPSRV